MNTIITNTQIIYLGIIVVLQFILLFFFFRKAKFDYDKIANIAKYSLIGIPIGIGSYFFQKFLASLYFILTSLSILGLYIEYVSYRYKKDEGYIE